MAEPFYITTAIDYTNAPPHLGHAYEKILADVLARFHRLKGDDVYFLTGVDQHGQKVQQAAAKQNIPPDQFVDALSGKFTELWQRLDVAYDGWAATTNPLHKRCVQEILQALHDAGDLYQATYNGYYSTRQEQFLTDKERGPDGNFGPEWGEVVELEETNWYFRLTKYRDWLIDFVQRTPGLVTPDFRQNELLNAAKKTDADLSITRPKSRLSWGIDIPFDMSAVTFVWFDALVNYISFAGYRQHRTENGSLEPSFPNPPAPGAKWPALHVIGKDILCPAHGIYWLCMLKAMGFPESQMPRFLVHGFVLVDGEKMSKSIGNVRDPHTFATQFGVGAFRYYLMRDCSVGADMEFTDERLIQRFNTDLANGLGNLLNRTLNMAHKYRQGRLSAPTVPSPIDAFDSPGGSVDLAALRTAFMHGVQSYSDAFNSAQVQTALQETAELTTLCNQLIDRAAPWKLAKDSAMAQHVDAVLYHLAEGLRILAILISPVLPHASAAILDQLRLPQVPRLLDASWGGLQDGHVLGTPSPIFPRIEVAK